FRFSIWGRVFVATALLASPQPSRGQLPEPPAQVAQRLMANTVTVRVATRDEEGQEQVSVHSGAIVSDQSELSMDLNSKAERTSTSMVVTQHQGPLTATVRVTLPGGAQARGQWQVVDSYSQLALLELDTALNDDPGLTIVDETPQVGKWVLTASGWGTRPPIVSLGILSATDAEMPRQASPPLLQSDVRTTETSAGAPLVDQSGHLIGIVVGSGGSPEPNGWTFAVPVQHVRRLIRARRHGQAVLLQRQRPHAGLILSAGDQRDTVVVQRVLEGGPAARAGIHSGDTILASDGIEIRSVYQALQPVLRKQPGDVLTLRVASSTDPRSIRDVAIVLDGRMANIEPELVTRGLVRQTVDVSRVDANTLRLRSRQQEVRNLSMPTSSGDSVLPRSESELLREAVQLIERLQYELDQRERHQQEIEERIRNLEAELSRPR
ncbi:MAG: serine protease, partial [Planctomycetales bacterium]|nr:serine protease [Planctomycetales bacterium]